MQQTALVLGLGVTGFSIAAYLRARKINFVVYDTRACPERLLEFQQKFPDVELWCEQFPAARISEFSRVITSPGIPPEAEILKVIHQTSLRIETDLDCLAQEIGRTPVVAITGSNGKSTVTTWVGEIAQCAGFNVAVGGNLGTPVLDLLLEQRAYDLWVLELSSFQLAAIQNLQIDVAVLLNISPDHLDIHGSMENYIAAKQRIFLLAKRGVFNRLDLATQPDYPLEVSESFGLTVPPTAQDWGVVYQDGEPYLARGSDLWLNFNALKLRGRHHWQNAMAVSAVCAMLEIPRQTIMQGLLAFTGLHHRTEWVADIAGVTYINDSKGTNLGATEAAIVGIGAELKGKIVLIAGGLGKGADFSALRSCLSQYVRHVVLIGQDAPILAQYWQDAVDLAYATSFKDAISQAKMFAQPGDVVLLSPACASFDMFHGYEDRGQQFTEIVREWL